jgi:hypothetical protein
MKIEEKNVCKFRSILNTFSIDENLKKKKKRREGGSGHESQKIKNCVAVKRGVRVRRNWNV